MQTFDQSLFGLYQKNLITYEEALRWCTNPEDFTLKVKGIQSTSDAWSGGSDNASGKEAEPKFKIDRFGR